MLRRETPNFIPPTLWPPNSQDLNPVDHKVWSVMEEQIYHTPIHDVNYLKHCLFDVWAVEWSTRPWQKFNFYRIGLHKVRSVLPLLSKIWSKSEADWITFRGHSRGLFIMP